MIIKTLKRILRGKDIIERIERDPELERQVMDDVAEKLTPYVDCPLITLVGPDSEPVIEWPGESS